MVVAEEGTEIFCAELLVCVIVTLFLGCNPETPVEYVGEDRLFFVHRTTFSR